MTLSLAALAPAKVNLTLRILGRRADGYHELDSLVAFAGCGDHLTFDAGPSLDLTVSGPTAGQAGAVADNLVLRAAKALADKVPGLIVGRFALTKELPAGAGLGGGSADAAAALRLLAEANGLALDRVSDQTAERPSSAVAAVRRAMTTPRTATNRASGIPRSSAIRLQSTARDQMMNPVGHRTPIGPRPLKARSPRPPPPRRFRDRSPPWRSSPRRPAPRPRTTWLQSRNERREGKRSSGDAPPAAERSGVLAVDEVGRAARESVDEMGHRRLEPSLDPAGDAGTGRLAGALGAPDARPVPFRDAIPFDCGQVAFRHLGPLSTT